MWLVDGFLHVLDAKYVWTWYDQTIFHISQLAAMISLIATGLSFREAAAQDQPDTRDIQRAVARCRSCS